MYDKYENPHGEDAEIYEKGPLDSAREIAGPLIEKAKANRKKIVAGIIVLAVLFLAYDFFIGSVRTVSFSVSDTEGNPVSASIRVLDTSGNEVARAKSGEQLSLKAGAYKIDVLSTDFKTLRAYPVNVSENGAIPVKLEIDKSIELAGTLPGTFATGETKEFTLTLKNNESLQENVKLVLEGDAAKVMKLDFGGAINAAPGDNIVSVKLNVDKSVDSKDLGKGKKFTIRIEGLDNSKAKVSGSYELVQFNDSKLKVKFGSSTTTANFGTVEAGETQAKQLKVENENDFEIKDIKIEVDITSTEFTDASEVKTWFEFSPANTVSVDAKNDSPIIGITLRVPADVSFPEGKIEETIKGVIYFRTSFFEKQLSLDLKISKPKTGISVSGIRDSYTIQKKDSQYPPERGFIEIRNSGEVLLNDFDVIVICDSTGVNWLTVNSGSTEAKFDSLAARETEKIPFEISIPASAKKDDTANCRVGVLYSEPNDDRQTVEVPVIITAG